MGAQKLNHVLSKLTREAGQCDRFWVLTGFIKNGKLELRGTVEDFPTPDMTKVVHFGTSQMKECFERLEVNRSAQSRL